jgi:isoleucyl-tRNA synthetase
VSLGHGLRKEHKLKVRQPLATAHIVSDDERILNFLRDQQHLIAEELNVKNVIFSHDESRFVNLKAKPNFRVLGKKVGKLMKAAQAAIDQFDQKQLTDLMNHQATTIRLEGEEVILTSEDVQVERIVRDGLAAANADLMTIVLETSLSEELLQEGLAREIINKVNTMRREAGFAVTDRVRMTLQTTDRVKACFKQYGDYICSEVLAIDVSFGSCEGSEWDLNGEPTIIALVKG